MGYYLNPPESAGEPFRKSAALVDHHGAVRLSGQPVTFEDVPEGKALICVVDAGMWEAALLVYNNREFDDVASPRDERSKTWLLMDKESAHKMAGYGKK